MQLGAAHCQIKVFRLEPDVASQVVGRHVDGLGMVRRNLLLDLSIHPARKRPKPVDERFHE